MLIWCELIARNLGSRDNLKMFKYEFITVHQCQSDFKYIWSIHEFVMFLFTVHARELLNLPGHGLGLDVSRKSRIRSGGFLKRKHGVLFGKNRDHWPVAMNEKQNTPSILFGCCFHGSSKTCFTQHVSFQEVELVGSKAVDYLDFDDAMDDCGGRAPFPCSHSRCHEFHENVHGFCPKHRLLRHYWKLASWWRTAPWPVVFSYDVL